MQSVSRFAIASCLRNSRAQHRLLLCSFAVLFIGVTLADRHQPSDEGAYIRVANDLLGRPHAAGGPPSPWFGPGLPILLAPLALIHTPLEVIRLLGPLLLLCAVLLFYDLMQLYVDRRTAVVTSAALGLYVPFYVLLPSLHSEIPALLLVVLFMYALARDLRERRARYFFLGAAALAYLALTRIVFGWILLAGLVVWLVAWLIRRDPRSLRIVAVHVLALALCAPWLAHTYSATHRVFYWGSSGGQSLYWMATPYPGELGDWHSELEVFSNPSLAPNRPEFTKLQRLDQARRGQARIDAVLQHDAIRLIQTHPTHYLRNLAANLSRIWFNMPYSFTPEHIGTLFYVVPNALLLAGLLASLGMLWLTRKNLPFELWGFLVLLTLGVAIQTLLSAYERMLTPLVPVIVLLIAVSRARYIQLVRGRAGETI